LTRKFRKENPNSTDPEAGSIGVWSERFTVEVGSSTAVEKAQLQLKKLNYS
jgi:hypothetical protein